MPLSPRILGALVALLLSISGTILGNFCLYAMIGEINGASPPEQRESLIMFTPPKLFRIFRRYGEIRPRGTLKRYFQICLAWAMGMLVLAAFLFSTAR